MTNATTQQETTSKRTGDNTQAFRMAYERLNYKQQQKEQLAFCDHYELSRGGFRARLAGTIRVSDTELAWLKVRVETYFTAPELQATA